MPKLADLTDNGNKSTTSRGASNIHRDTVPASIAYGAVIHITNNEVKPNVLKPWKVFDPVKSTGTGFTLSDRMIITNRHVIKNSSSIRLERHGQPGNFEGCLLCESKLCDLALLTVDDESFWEELPTLQLQDTLPALDDNVIAVGYPLGAKSVTVTRGVVSNVALTDLTLEDHNPRQLQIQIDAAINPGNSGGPVFNSKSGEVVGVAFAGKSNAEGQGFIIPVPVMRLFVDRYKKTKENNFGLLPELGVTTASLENPDMRKSCFGGGELPKHRDGCIVTAVNSHGSAADKIQVGDILLKIDGIAVSEKCEVIFREHEWLNWQYLITRKPVGDSVKVTVLRQAECPKAKERKVEGAGKGKEIVELDIELKPLPSLVPRILNVDYFPRYIVVGGLVFLPIGTPIQTAAIKESGGRITKLWKSVVDAAMGPGLRFPDQQLCVLAAVLAHSVNVSYDRMIGDVVSKVNFVEVRNMKHMASLISGVKSGELVIDFTVPDESCMRSHVVFDAERIRSIEAEIFSLHKIEHWCSPQLLQ